MSIDIPRRTFQSPGVPGGVRFRPRDEPPEPLFGPPNVDYPARDGRPRADNTIQDRWIDKIKGGLEALYRDDPGVFVASNLMWYPVEGVNRRRLAPDAMVLFGRPKGDRPSYVQHREGGLGPQVVLEVLSPGNRKRAMDDKRMISEKYGVEEYYVFDPYRVGLEAWLREGDAFRPVPDSDGWVSPRLGIRFELGEDLTIYAPAGRPFLDYAEVARERDDRPLEAKQAGRRARRADRRADLEGQRAEAERLRAEAQERATEHQRLRAEAQEQATQAEHRRAEAEHRRAERLAARLRELGLEPDE